MKNNRLGAFELLDQWTDQVDCFKGKLGDIRPLEGRNTVKQPQRALQWDLQLNVKSTL